MAEKVELTMQEVAKHNTASDAWIIIGNSTNGGPKVYNVTNYLDEHPGGREVLVLNLGKNADRRFEDNGHPPSARRELEKFLVGELVMTEEEKAAALADDAARKAPNDDCVVS